MNTSVLLNFLNTLENQSILSSETNKKIQNFLDYSTKSQGKLFLVYTAVIGALFISAGVFALISHNWDDFPQHVRGALSFVPSLAALYVYYLAVFKHSNSTSWIEASSLFLMLMIGASIALVSQTYQMDGDFDRFILVWLVLTVPLFYIANASGIAIFYLMLSLKFLSPDIDFMFFGRGSIDVHDKYYFFWMFLFAYLPHFYMAIKGNNGRQGFRGIYLGWVTAIIFIIAMPFAIKAGFLWWGIATYMGFYLIGKKFYGGNLTSLGRPFQTITLIVLVYFLLLLSVEWFSNMIFRHAGTGQLDSTEQYVFYYKGLLLAIGLTAFAIYLNRKGMALNRYVIYSPILIAVLYLIYIIYQAWGFNMEWLGFLLLNCYILGLGINAMVQGNKSKNILYMFFGLLTVSFLMWVRYFDMDISFWLKGLFFIGVGFMFLLIHYVSSDEFEN